MSKDDNTTSFAGSLRLGTPDDAEAIAALHAESWRSAYRGLVPDDDLGEELDGERQEFWRSAVRRPPSRSARRAFFAMSDDLLVGFACVLADADPEHGPLLDNLHVKPGWRGRGIGALLLDEARLWSAVHRAGRADAPVGARRQRAAAPLLPQPGRRRGVNGVQSTAAA